MPGEANAVGAAPRYKGAASAQQSVQHKFVRGKGWTSTKRDKGTIDQLKGQMGALTAYANEITIDDAGIYSELMATWTGIEPGSGADVDVIPIWQLNQIQGQIPLITGEVAKALDARNGYKAVPAIKAAVRTFKSLTEAQVLKLTLPYSSPIILANVASDDWQLATDIMNDIIGDNDLLVLFHPVLTRTIIVQSVALPYKQTSPPIYNSTTILKAHIDIPATIQAAIPDTGQWLETPPTVDETVQGKFQIHQTWEWFDSIPTRAYPNRIVS